MAADNLYAQFKGNSYNAIKYIVKNNKKIQSLQHGQWKDCTLREMLWYLVGNDTDTNFYNWFLTHHRIKKASEEEVKSLTQANKNED